ncbi:MAG: adenylyl-sulfate kinase [Candidatus Diapherotrites archaeon]|nr:adenylyl-sulfate kinase [Candidatus Diapherotrites archaeon]
MTGAGANERRHGFVVWLTGLPGSGKSTITAILSRKISSKGFLVETLDGDAIRQNISKGLGFSRDDIIENNKRIVFLSGLIERHGGVSIVPVITPFAESRAHARKELQHYLEVFVDCPLGECEKRDPKGMYKKAREGHIKDFIGIHTEYERPETPDAIVHTDRETPEESAQKIFEALERKGWI